MNTIIYIGGFELPDKNAAAHRVINNAKLLKELGYNVVLVDVDRECTDKIENTKSTCFGFSRFSMKYSNKRLTNINDFIAIMNFYSSDNVKVIAYNYPGIALWKMKRYCHKHNIQIFADCTEWYGMLGNNSIKRIIKGFDSYIRMSIVQPKLDGIIVISRYMEKFYKNKLPTICIPPLTDLSDEKWNRLDCEGHNEIRIMYAGNPGRHKDKLNLMIEAIHDLKNEKLYLDIVGITKEQFLNYYPEDTKLLNSLKNQVNFHGRLSHNQVIKMLKQADFSMFYREITRITMAGFPTKFSESITCGTPVITNRTSDLEEYMLEGINGYWIDENISNSLQNIIKKGILPKNEIDCSVFDYHRYFDEFKKIL